MCPSGTIRQLDGCYPGSKHDAGNFGHSQAYAKLEKILQGHYYCLNGDPTYPLRPLLQKPYGGASLTPEQCTFIKAKSSDVEKMYKASALLANYHTCLYGAEVSHAIYLEPPCLEVYLNTP
ncbi:hypothetical protein MRX96_000433 [Rhipicephalus microplus]